MVSPSRRTFAKHAMAAILLARSWGMEDRQGTARSDMATQFLPSFDGVPIAYEMHGSGPATLVLVHGWSCDRSYWRHQLAPLAATYRIVMLDLAGHGESGSARRTWTIESFGEDVAAVLRHVDAAPVLLVGHSMGGDVAVEAARRLGPQVRGLIWIDTYKQLGNPRTADEVAALIAPFRNDFATEVRVFVRSMFLPGADPALVEQVADDMADAPPSIALAAIEASLTYGRTITDAIARIDVPIVAINPDAPPTDRASMERHDVAVVTMSSVGHFPMLDAPDRFNALLSEVVRERFGARLS
jgi:pimeloyl-ACP methyl ester carboxylesterase